MLRAVLSVSPRAKLPHALVLMKSINHSILAQSKLHQSPSLSRQLVRNFASGDDQIKGSVSENQSGIIGTIGSQATMGHATGAGDSTTCAQVQAATFGTREDKISKQGDCDAKTGTVTSQMRTTPSLTECRKVGTDESASAPKKSKPKDADSAGNSSRAGSVSNLADDAVKQLQEAAANLPSKAQVEKFVFRVLAFAYDILYLTGTWTIRFVNEKILQNPNVKYYWKRFHDKMEQAKKE